MWYNIMELSFFFFEKKELSDFIDLDFLKKNEWNASKMWKLNLTTTCHCIFKIIGDVHLKSTGGKSNSFASIMRRNEKK